MELSNDYLTVKLRRLKGVEVMELAGRGLLFVILKGGAGVCECGRQEHRLESGDVLVVESASGGKINVRGGGEVVFWFFLAEFEHMFPLFSGREICLLRNVAAGFESGRVYPGSSSLARQCLKLVEEVPVQFSLDHRSHVLRIISTILSTEFKAVQPKLSDVGPARDHILQIFERLQANELLTLSVGELAKKFNCSRRHLNRLFHQHFGLSVAALRMEMRLLKAVSLLVDPDAKIIHVAEKCGFNHLGLFNTCFKKRFGTSPSQWRKDGSNGELPNGEPEKGHPSCPMHANGMCPWTPHPDDLSSGAQKALRTEKLRRPSGLPNPKLRETILRDIREVSARMKYKSSVRSSATEPALRP